MKRFAVDFMTGWVGSAILICIVFYMQIARGRPEVVHMISAEEFSGSLRLLAVGSAATGLMWAILAGLLQKSGKS